MSQMLGNLHTLRTEALYGEQPGKLSRAFNLVEQDFCRIKYLLDDDENEQIEVSAIS